MWNPRNPAAVGLYRLQNFKPKPSKRRCTDARAEIRFFKSARALFFSSCSGALGKWSLGVQQNSARRAIRSDGWNFLVLICFWFWTWFSEEQSLLVSGALPLGTPRAVSAARPHKGNRSALYSNWSLGPISCNDTKTTQNQGLYHEAQVNNVS